MRFISVLKVWDTLYLCADRGPIIDRKREKDVDGGGGGTHDKAVALSTVTEP